jgi:hypothetical protein
VPYADPARAREASRARYARLKDDPEFRERKKAASKASYRRDLEGSRSKKRRASAKSRHSLTDAQLDALLAVETCQLCGGTARLVIDHDHATGEIRGVICSGCNGALGWFEKPGWLAQATAYLEAHGNRT